MDIYGHFACYEVLPVKLEDVMEHAKENGGASEYRLCPVDVNPSVLHGLCWVYEPSDAPGTTVACIYYSTALAEQSPYQWRIVCCKEILHTLDNDGTTAESEHAVSKLIDGIAAPTELHQMLPSTFSDYIGDLRALMILLPRDALAALREKHNAGEISIEKISELAKIPTDYVRLALSPQWEEVVEALN